MSSGDTGQLVWDPNLAGPFAGLPGDAVAVRSVAIAVAAMPAGWPVML